jgi:hypothetical protein
VTGPWTQLAPSTPAHDGTIDTSTDRLGYFAAGYPSNAVSHIGGGSHLLPLMAAAVIVAVLLVVISVSIVRRRR